MTLILIFFCVDVIVFNKILQKENKQKETHQIWTNITHHGIIINGEEKKNYRFITKTC